MAPVGRPSKFTDALATAICVRLSNGESLREICRDEALPHRGTIVRWLIDKSEKFEAFRAQYDIARKAQAQLMADDLIDIADDGSNDWMTRRYGETEVDVPNPEVLNRSRLRVDTRKWVLSKVLPKVYGDKVALEHTGPNGGPITTATITTDDPAEAAKQYQKIVRGDAS